MSFFTWLASQKPEQPQESQLDLFQQSQDLTERKRIDGTIGQKKLTKAIKDKGGTGKVYPQVNNAITEELFDCGVAELYGHTNSKPGDRGTLPTDAQAAYLIADVKASFDIESADIQGKPHERNQHIINTAAKSAKETRKWLPW